MNGPLVISFNITKKKKIGGSNNNDETRFIIIVIPGFEKLSTTLNYFTPVTTVQVQTEKNIKILDQNQFFNSMYIYVGGPKQPHEPFCSFRL